MSCGIADHSNEVYYITGNNDIKFSKSVLRYDTLGYLDDQPDLNVGRRNHACSGYYKTNNGDHIFVLVVVGGQGDHQGK